MAKYPESRVTTAQFIERENAEGYAAAGSTGGGRRLHGRRAANVSTGTPPSRLTALASSSNCTPTSDFPRSSPSQQLLHVNLEPCI